MKFFVRAFAIAVVAFGALAVNSLAKNPTPSTPQIASHSSVNMPPVTCWDCD